MYLVQLPQTGCNSLLGPSEALYVTGDASIWSLVVVSGQNYFLTFHSAHATVSQQSLGIGVTVSMQLKAAHM